MSTDKSKKTEKHFKFKGALAPFGRHTKQTCANSNGTCNYPKLFPELPSNPRQFQRHHLLPIQSVSKYHVLDSYSAEERKSIDRVLMETKWCSSREQNMIALAQKQIHWGTTSTVLDTVPNEIKDHPCHNWDHWGCPGCYNDEVTITLHFRLWQKIKEVKDTEVCTSAKQVLAELGKLEQTFRDRLGKRGKRPLGKGGTAAGREAAGSASPHKDWWLTFSMARVGVARNRLPLVHNGGIDVEWAENKSDKAETLVNALLSKKLGSR